RRGQEKYIFCTLCDRFMFGARHTMMHMANHDHIIKTKNASANNLMRMMAGDERIARMVDEESKTVEKQKKEYQSMKLPDDVDQWRANQITLYNFTKQLAPNVYNAGIAESHMKSLQEQKFLRKTLSGGSKFQR
ncbi:hypothetical protein PMAYCL1PPCAC_00575, partial [Pristionchus mayeri]